MRRNGKTCSPTTVEHLRRREVLEARPAEVVVGAACWSSLPSGKTRRSIGFFSAVGLVLLQRVQVVEALDEQQVGDLLDDLERVGDAAGPEGVPDAIDLTADFAGEHECF